MAQYEQKTDSREFEVANPDQHLVPWGENAPADPADIAIRLWGPALLNRPVAATWKADSILVYMIADLVTASRGRIAEESPTVMAAHFDTGRHALVAAKRIQTSILEFVACRPGERVGGAILIYQPRTADPTGPSVEMVQYELGQAKPGQILLTENVSQRLRDLPGIEFLAAPEPGSISADGSPGLTELIWTTPEQVALLRESMGDGTGQRGEPRRDDSPVGATLIVDSPKLDSPFARRNPADETVPPVAATADFLFKDGSETRSRRESQVLQDFQRSPGSSSTRGSFEEGIELGERPLFTRTRIILGVAALILVAALIAVFFRPTGDSKPPRITQQQDQTGGTKGTGQQPPVNPQPETKTDQPETQTVVPGAKPATVVKPSKDNHPKSKKETPAEPEVTKDSGGWSVGDIPRLLKMAGDDMGVGNYDKAKLEYNRVLSLRSSDQDAKDGLKKIDKIQKERQ
jgi:hypothetical protein